LVSGFQSNLQNGRAGVAQARGRAFQTQSAHVFRNAFAGERAKYAVKVASGKVGYTGQLRQREFVVQVLLKVLDRPPDSSLIIVPGRLPRHQNSLPEGGL